MDGTPFDVGRSLLGPFGGQLALAFGAGCAAGYAFCIRTVYKLLGVSSEARHQECLKRISTLENENTDLKTRLKVIEDRLYTGHSRELQQVRDSAISLITRSSTRKGPRDV